jgi:hypothetical protein
VFWVNIQGEMDFEEFIFLKYFWHQFVVAVSKATDNGTNAGAI